MLTSADLVYLDSSALVKLVVHEAESAELDRYLSGQHGRASCVLAWVEVVRAVRGQGPSAVARARGVLADLLLVRLDNDILDTAAEIDPPALRSLDAIHLAAARALGSRLATVVTYDQRMAQAARALGLTVAAPGVALGF